MKTPSAWTAPKPTARKVTAAKMDMSESIAGSGRCPACHKAMETAKASNFDMKVCGSCRIALPVRDEQT